jgi:glycosyltransferase involved in cell wall biosynthesis
MTTRPRLSVLIPAFNEAAGLAHCVELVYRRLVELETSAEILIVDDASHDDTAAIAERLAAANPDVRLVRHAVNGGIGRAFVTGVAAARGEWLILIPADLALQPSELSRYLDATRGADIVVGNRSDMSDYSFFRRLVHYANITLIRVLFGMPLRQFQYISLYRLALLRQMDIEFAGSAFMLAEILIKAHALGACLVEVPIRYLPRASGQATGARWKLIVATLRDMVTFWWRWVRLGPVAAARRRSPAQPSL